MSFRLFCEWIELNFFLLQNFDVNKNIWIAFIHVWQSYRCHNYNLDKSHKETVLGALDNRLHKTVLPEVSQTPKVSFVGALGFWVVDRNLHTRWKKWYWISLPLREQNSRNGEQHRERTSVVWIENILHFYILINNMLHQNRINLMRPGSGPQLSVSCLGVCDTK